MENMLLDLALTIKEIVENAKSVPLTTDKCMVDREPILEHINKILSCIPDEINQATDIVKTKEQILNDAQFKADDIVNSAKKKALFLMNEQEVLKNAEKEAKEILLNAKTKSAEIKKLSTNYCGDSLQRTEESIASILEDVKNIRQKFNS